MIFADAEPCVLEVRQVDQLKHLNEHESVLLKARQRLLRSVSSHAPVVSRPRLCMREAKPDGTQTTMKPPPYGTGVACDAAAAPLKWLGTITTPSRPHAWPGRPGAQSCSPVRWLLLLILLCPLAAAFGLGIPVPGERGPTNILLNAWSFTDTTNWLSDQGSAPVSFTNLSVSDLGAGTAVVVDSTEPAWLQYNLVENDGTTNLALGQGSFSLWFAPNWSGTNAGGTGPGVSGRLIEAGSYTEDAS
jgi:hypothetical protein